MSLVDYLASKYLTKDPSSDKKAHKKRKRKEAQANGANVAVVDDDALGWERDKDDEDDEDRPVTVTDTRSSEFRKSKKQAWTTIQAAENAAADAIINSASLERNQASTALAEDEAPVVVGSVIQMESGAHAGLQTAAQVTAAMAKKRRQEMKEFEAVSAEEAGKGKETIYRDASGRIINIQMQKAEARKKMQEEEEAAKREKEMQKGTVQIAQEAARREAVEKAKFAPFARTKDDVEMNEELKEKQRWNDPAAAFLASKKDGKSASGFPLYKGASQPNRYGILPGHRWDGVDRGNGTEAQFFKRRNEKKDRKEMEYAWQMDV